MGLAEFDVLEADPVVEINVIAGEARPKQSPNNKAGIGINTVVWMNYCWHFYAGLEKPSVELLAWEIVVFVLPVSCSVILSNSFSEKWLKKRLLF